MMKWSEEDRRIFEYPSVDGSAKLFADPLAVRRKLMARSAGKIDDIVDIYRASIEAGNAKADGEIKDVNPGVFVQGDNAEEQIVQAVRYAFDLKPFDPKDGSGAPAKYCLRLFDWFTEWREQKKTSEETTPSSSPPSDSLPEHLRSHTKCMSDFAGIQSV